HLVHFQADNQLVDVRKLRYPGSRFRYLRVRVFPDAGGDDNSPAITSLFVSRTTQLSGEYRTAPAHLAKREPVRVEGGPAGSAWVIDFGGETPPCERLRFEIADDDFVRPYQLETGDADEQRRLLASGEWRRRAGGERQAPDIRFEEVRARRLRLV